jgi:hypothetical protein
VGDVDVSRQKLGSLDGLSFLENDASYYLKSFIFSKPHTIVDQGQSTLADA